MRIIIVGAGKVGYNLASRLSREQQDVVVIERQSARLRHISDELDVQTIQGSGTSPRDLQRAGLSGAGMIIAVTDQDEANLTACLISQAYAPNMIRIARIRDAELADIANDPTKFHMKLDLAINPERLAVDKILRHLSIPAAIEVVHFADGKVTLIGVRIDEDSPVSGKTLAMVRSEYPECLVAALSRRGGAIIPMGEEVLLPGDIVYAVTSPERIRHTLSFFGKDVSPAERVIIGGGTSVGLLLAMELEKKGIGCKIIEENAERCDFLAELLDRTIVLQGDSTDEDLLRNEHVEATDTFIGASDDEESNVISALLARNLGARGAITLADNPAYTRIMPLIGIDITISPRLLAVSSILHYVRRGKVLSVSSFNESDAEALEFVALESSEIVGRPLRELKFPKGAIIGAVVREGETIIPAGETIIQPQDRVIVFALREAIPKVEKALTIKLEYT